MMVGCDDAGTTEFRSAETFQARFPWPSCAGRSTTCVDRGRPSIPLPALHDTPFVCASVTAPRDPVAPADHDLVQQPAVASVTTPHAQRETLHLIVPPLLLVLHFSSHSFQALHDHQGPPTSNRRDRRIPSPQMIGNQSGTAPWSRNCGYLPGLVFVIKENNKFLVISL